MSFLEQFPGTFLCLISLLCVAGLLPDGCLRFLLEGPTASHRSALLVPAAEAPPNLLLQWVGCKHW